MTQTEYIFDGIRVDDDEQELHVRLFLRGEFAAAKDRVARLRGILVSFPGRCAVIAHVAGPYGRETLLAVGDIYRTEPTGLLFGAIERLLGPDSWRLTPAGTRGKWESLP